MGKKQISSRRPLSQVDSTVTEATDPHAYTSGHWLNMDQRQHERRYRAFNFDALCKKAVKCSPGASRVISFEKKEGGFNRIFILTMDDGVRTVAKVPYPIAGPQRLTTGSEVATMQYLRNKTKVPIPNVLSWSDDPGNPIGCEYIIMDHARGVSLHNKWPLMNPRQKMLCVKALGMMVPSISNPTFPAYGSIYFANSPHLNQSHKVQFEDEFCIGPFCNQNFCDPLCGETDILPDDGLRRGPFDTLSQYSHALIEMGRSRLPDSKSDESLDLFAFKGLIKDHERLFTNMQLVLTQLIALPEIQRAAAPTLMHYDFHKRNIFVSEDDPIVVTDIIDWQSSSIEPGFVYANEIPDFTVASPDPASAFAPDPGSDQTKSKLSGNANATAESEDQDAKAARICSEAFELILKVKAPKLALGRALDETLLRPFRYAATSSRDGVTAGRQELVELYEKWSSELGLPGSCPYKPSTLELEQHKKNYEEFESVLELKQWLMTALQTTSDGWVPNEAWHAARAANKAAFEEWMTAARSSDELTEEQARAMWPFMEMAE